MNVKVGDLAIIIKSALSQNIGKIVTVIKYSGAEVFGEIDLWLVEATGPMVGTMVHKDTGLVAGLDNTTSLAHVRDANLRPVSGLDDPDYNVTDEPIKSTQL